MTTTDTTNQNDNDRTARVTVLELLAEYRAHGHAPIAVGTFTIGRGRYAFGMFTTPPRPIIAGCRAHAEGKRWTAPETRLVMVRADSSPHPMPRAYRRNQNTMIRFPAMSSPNTYYVSGWSRDMTAAWLNVAPQWMHDETDDNGQPQPIVDAAIIDLELLNK